MIVGAVADFNRDGEPDQLVLDFFNNVVDVLLGNGDGTFATGPSTKVGLNPRAIAVGDFNNDDIPDFAVADSGDGTVTVFLGRGNGSFSAACGGNMRPINLVALLALSGVSLSQEPVQHEASVNVNNGNSTFMREIAEAGIQSRHPIAIVLGKQGQALCSQDSATDIKPSTAQDALKKISTTTGYTLSQTGGVYTLIDPGVEQWQLDILSYKFDKFPAFNNVTMQYLAAQLSGWIETTLGKSEGYGGAISGRGNAKEYNLESMSSASVQEIANQIASLGDGGIWIMHPTVPDPKGANDIAIEILPYGEENDAIRALMCGQKR